MYEHVEKYKDLDTDIFNGSVSVGRASQVVAFTNPEFLDRMNNPDNALGNEIKRKQEADQSKQKVKLFATILHYFIQINEYC